ncbi:hypothetical protein EMPS_01567 [Entomortierella parvispora]|uniref:UspA domain-containing protein n=1 Tax=Entomortierella parvispora TaxID=205924 RepID=A0A9P3LSP0_9FUNG|nr:hypothetical protein EMPS_01567 [Entomortierella parvispora]
MSTSTSNSNLIISTSPADDDDGTQAMPLSPASVKGYQRNKALKSNKTSSGQERPFSEEESEDDDDAEEESYDSDRKSIDEDDEDDDFDPTHLDPRFEAMDGTTKLKTAAEKKQEEDDEEEELDGSNEEDDSNDVLALRGAVSNLSLDGQATKGASSTQVQSSLSSKILSGGEFYQDPSSPGAATQSNLNQEERLQEPVKPHIALPCLVETANNPARTRITLKYSGNDHTSALHPADELDQKASTRGRKNYMVATDLSGESWHATEWAISTILRNGDELNVVTIVEDEKSDNSKGIKKGVQTEMREDAEKLTKNIHEQLEHTCLKDITVVIHIIAATKSMGAKELLIEMIDDLDDLSTVIVGSRGRGAIKGLLLGSISNFLVHNSSVPVMVVRAPKKSKNKKKARRGRALEQTRSVREANLKYEQAFANDD